MTDTLLVLLTIPLVDMSLRFHLYKIHNLPLLDPTLKKSLHYEIADKYFAIGWDMRYITFPDDDNTLSCIVSTGQVCRLYTTLHVEDRILDCSSFIIENNKEKISKYC